MKDNKFRFGLLLKNIGKLKKELPVVLAVKTQSYFLKSFKEQGWEGKEWKKPQREFKGKSKWKGKPTLVNVSRLRGAVGASVRTRNWELIQLVVDLPYAKRHNEGLDGMPARPFMKDSVKLRALQKEMIKKHIDKLWQG